MFEDMLRLCFTCYFHRAAEVRKLHINQLLFSLRQLFMSIDLYIFALAIKKVFFFLNQVNNNGLQQHFNR